MLAKWRNLRKQYHYHHSQWPHASVVSPFITPYFARYKQMHIYCYIGQMYHTLQEYYFMNIMEIYLIFFSFRLHHPQKYGVYTIKGSKQKHFSMFSGEIIPDHYRRSSRYERCSRFGRFLWSDFNSKSRYKKGSARNWGLIRKKVHVLMLESTRST